MTFLRSFYGPLIPFPTTVVFMAIAGRLPEKATLAVLLVIAGLFAAVAILVWIPAVLSFAGSVVLALWWCVRLERHASNAALTPRDGVTLSPIRPRRVTSARGPLSVASLRESNHNQLDA